MKNFLLGGLACVGLPVGAYLLLFILFGLVPAIPRTAGPATSISPVCTQARLLDMGAVTVGKQKRRAA